MVNIEENQLSKLEGDLREARFRQMRAEQELKSLDRQAGLTHKGRRAPKELVRAEQRLEKCQQKVTNLLQSIEDLKNPQPSQEPEAETEDTSGQEADQPQVTASESPEVQETEDTSSPEGA